MQPRSGLDRARTALESGRRFALPILRDSIARSWERCVGYGLDPLGSPQGPVVTSGDLEDRRGRSAVLRRLALAEMQLLQEQIAGSNMMIAFADRDGVVLDTMSDHRFVEQAGGSIVPGSVWQELDRGTNALGLCAIEREPVAIYGREHFFAAHGRLSCMAAPILDSEGNVAGILDASCANEARQQHTHALVRMAATGIENGLIFQQQARLLILAFHPRAEFLDTLSAGLLALTRDGEVRGLNRQARILLAGLSARLGSGFEELFDTRFARATANLLSGGVVRLRDRAGSAVFMACRQIGQSGEGRLRRHQPDPVAVLSDSAELGFVAGDGRLAKAMRGLAGATRLRMPVTISGETGTGKEHMARYVHVVSGRKGEFVAVNCGAITESLFVGELFGHERGAFTSARPEGAAGLVRQADKGTLFLDEVADIPLAAQTALLRFLDSMEVRAVGGSKVARVDVQIVSATNCRLEDAVAERRFRADLFFRLNAFAVELPPLRDRTDFAAIVRHLLARIAPETAITDEAIQVLEGRNWPGNIRELNGVLQRAAIEADASFLDETSFEQAPEPHADVCPDCRGHPLNAGRCRHIRATFRAADSNIAEAARLLGVARNTVYKHIR